MIGSTVSYCCIVENLAAVECVVGLIIAYVLVR